jgi:hypothetical protein
MRYWWAVAVATALALTSAATARAQSIYGPGGLLLNPTADVPKVGQLTPAILFVPQKSRALGGLRNWTSVTLDYGAAERWEVGATFLKASGFPGGRDPSFGGFAKYQVLPGTGRGPAVAVGGGVLTGGDSNAQTAFIALRQNLTSPDAAHPLRLHVGGFYANELSGVDRDHIVPYGGLEYILSRRANAFVEWRGKMPTDVDAAVSVGVLLKPAADYRLALAMANNAWGDGLRFSFGVGYAIGIRR